MPPHDPVTADREHDPALLPGAEGEFLRVGQAAAVLGVESGPGLPQQAGDREQGRRPG